MLRRRSRSGARIISLMSAIAMLGGQVYFPFEAKAEESESWKATDLIKNGDFETGDLSGWTVDMPDSDGDAVGYKIKVDEWASNNKTNILNYWNNNESASFEFSQDIKDVKAGTYKLSFEADGAEDESGLKLSLNGESVSIKTSGWDNWSTFSTESFTVEEKTDLNFKISGEISSGYWGDLDNFVLYKLESNENSDDEKKDEDSESEEDKDKDKDKDKEQEAEEADIIVKPVDGCDEDFITGVDVSSYLALKDSGVKYYDYDGNELSNSEYFVFLKECGVNYVRIRVWNDPKDSEGNGYGGGNCDLNRAIKIGKWVTDAGMKVLIDFHYSDFWADPGKQTAPKAWQSMTIDEKEEALEKFTVDSLQKLIDAGVDVGMVQVGNETNNGIAGEKSWENMAKLFSAGSKGVRKVAKDNDKDILAAIHFTNPETSGRYEGYAKNLKEYDVDYDVFASSYYPYWHGTLSNLKSVLSNIADNYNKKVMVAETSYVYTLEDGDGCENTEREGKNDPLNFDVSTQGQADSVRSVVETVVSVKGGIGVFYWEPAWLPVQVYDKDADDAEEVLASNKEKWEKYGSGWAASYAKEFDKDVRDWGAGGAVVENEAWFDFEGHPLSSAKIYKYIRTGVKAKVKILRVEVSDVEFELGDEIKLPETATAIYNDGTKIDKEVLWNETELADAKEKGVGEFEISGTVETAEETFDVVCKVTVKPKNYLVNAGFEDGDKAWTIDDKGNTNGNNGVGVQADASNVKSGSMCLKFWDNEAIDYIVEQKITLDKGIYKLGAFVEGGDCGESAEFKLYAKVKDEILSADTGVTGWQNWANPEIDSITVKADGTEVTVGVSVKAASGGWGAWDDFYLYRTGDFTGADSSDDVIDDDNKDDNPDIDNPGDNGNSGNDGGNTGNNGNQDNNPTDDNKDNKTDNAKVIIEQVHQAVKVFVEKVVVPVVKEVCRVFKRIFGWF
ncbi:arabinogalactan endo-1,4-beta-galactosidase [Pseudobutyrivibrio sp. ACV-2]|uniref:glycosyl hydrolase 53 family protein n=1 Tax=Pseudobutyrivibrio sp. ACV-2 TaxID=1520801 RepID=UPI0008996BF4|nr:glycosyl hydrolase 53 family protein [Pseudobutyrivibrio sp. ACV-2]SEA88296.1 arabinogalactan endo-1,4-beta-galactosidase [Pseudobutyrivibrio sp. ACV-2]